MGLIFGISRVWDAITDPLAGYLSDRMILPFGRRRPWILMSIPCVVGTFYMMWNPPQSLEGTGLAAWMLVSVLLFYTSMTAFFVPHTALGAELSTNYHERTRIFGVRHMVLNTGSLLALIGMYILIIGDEPRRAALYITILASLVA